MIPRSLCERLGTSREEDGQTTHLSSLALHRLVEFDQCAQVGERATTVRGDGVGEQLRCSEGDEWMGRLLALSVVGPLVGRSDSEVWLGV